MFGISRSVVVSAAAKPSATNGSRASWPPAVQPALRRARVVGEAEAVEAGRLGGPGHRRHARPAGEVGVVRVGDERVGQ